MLTARYGHGARVDQPLTMARDLDASGSFDPGESFYYHADHQGSVLFLIDEAGLVANEYRYDAYGRPITLIEAVENPYLYTGREFDPESGLYHYRARAYDPATGRFLQEDPIHFAAGDLNLYRYVFNNPVNLTDPSGLAVIVPPGPDLPPSPTIGDQGETMAPAVKEAGAMVRVMPQEPAMARATRRRSRRRRANPADASQFQPR